MGASSSLGVKWTERLLIGHSGSAGFFPYAHELRRLFARDIEPLPGPERAELLDALAAAASPASWDYLRKGRSLSPHRARAVMTRTLGALPRDAGLTAD